MTLIDLKEEERLDDLHINNYKIIQHPKNFCFGMDAVLLTGFVDTKIEGNILDLGTGTGIIPILLEAKTNAATLTGLEIQKDSVDMARRSIKINKLEDKIKVVEGDIKRASEYFPLAGFDVITSNPPYMTGQGLTNENKAKAIARHEIYCTLEDVIGAAAKLVKVGGKFYMVHRPNRLTDIMVLLRQYRLEPKRLRLVHPYRDKAPNMVLIEAIRHGRPMLKVEPPLVVYKDKNSYTDEIFAIYGMEKRS